MTRSSQAERDGPARIPGAGAVEDLAMDEPLSGSVPRQDPDSSPVESFPAALLPAHVADLARSTISAGEALSAGVRSVGPGEVSAAVGFPVGSGGFWIPYPSTDGFRIRLDRPHVFQDQGEAKYLSARSAEVRLYLPVGVDGALRADRKCRVVLVEGEKKALAAWLRLRVPAIGIPGVWAWKSKTRPSGVLEDLERLQSLLENRHVTIAFDSDARTNVMVARAAEELAEWLGAIAGTTIDWAFPEVEVDGRKVGLDDLMHHSGPEAALELLESPIAPQDGVPFVFRQSLNRIRTERVDAGRLGAPVGFVGSGAFHELRRLLPLARASIRHALAEEARTTLGLSLQDRAALVDELPAVDGDSRGAGKTPRPHPYAESSAGIVLLKSTPDGAVTVPLTNFTARIRREVVEDDGEGLRHAFEIEAVLGDLVRTFTVSAPEFASMKWTVEQLGAAAVKSRRTRRTGSCAESCLPRESPCSRASRHSSWLRWTQVSFEFGRAEVTKLFSWVGRRKSLRFLRRPEPHER